MRVRLPLSAPGHPTKLNTTTRWAWGSCTVRSRHRLDTKRGNTDVSIKIEVRPSGLFERALVSLVLVLLVALIYQLIVGGVKIEVAGGRLTVDTSGFIYWWQIVTGAVTPQK